MQLGQIDLIQRLCVAAGTIMEDANVEAVSLVSVNRAERQQRLKRLQQASADMAALISAAAALDRHLLEDE